MKITVSIAMPNNHVSTEVFVNATWQIEHGVLIIISGNKSHVYAPGHWLEVISEPG